MCQSMKHHQTKKSRCQHFLTGTLKNPIPANRFAAIFEDEMQHVSPFFFPKLFEQLPRSQCKLRTKGAYGVLAERQPARGARDREVQHVTQRERVELATARCRATDSTLHQRRAQPWAAAARKGGGARWTRSRSKVRRNCWHSSLQRPPTSAARITSR